MIKQTCSSSREAFPEADVFFSQSDSGVVLVSSNIVANTSHVRVHVFEIHRVPQHSADAITDRVFVVWTLIAYCCDLNGTISSLTIQNV